MRASRWLSFVPPPSRWLVSLQRMEKREEEFLVVQIHVLKPG
jgi:hypothetical protein